MQKNLYLFLFFFIFISISYGADDFANSYETEASDLIVREGAVKPIQEASPKILTTLETIGAIIIIPVKWVDSVVNQFFYILIPLKGVSANAVPGCQDYHYSKEEKIICNYIKEGTSEFLYDVKKWGSWKRGKGAEKIIYGYFWLYTNALGFDREPRDKQPHHVLEGFACSGCGNKFVSDALEDGFTMTCATVPPGLPNKYLPPQVRGLWVDDSILRKLFLSGVRIYLDDSKLIKNETHVQRIFTIARESHCQNCVVLPDKYVQKQLLKQIASGSDLGFMSDIINVNEDPNGSTEFFEHNIDRLKELIREIIESNLPGQITDQAIQLLEVMDSGTKSVNPKYALDLVGNIIGCGGIPYILCRLSFIGTGAAIANVPGAYEGFVLGQPVCLLVLGTGTAAGIAKTGLENAYFRDGEDSGTGKAQKGGAMEPASKSTNNQIKKYQDQLETDGIESIKKSKSSLESNLNVHKQKLDIIKSEGGYTSSVEKEIRNFEGEIKAIERVLEKIGGKP